MRVVLADLKGGEGFISKDTVAGGYGSRLRPFSKVTLVISGLKGWFHDLPSVHLAYTHSQLQFLLGAAYTRFYMRPSFLANFLRIRAPHVRRFVSALDAGVGRLQSRLEFATMERSL